MKINVALYSTRFQVYWSWHIFVAIVKKQAFVDATEEAAGTLFDTYKKQFVEMDQAVATDKELTDTEILAVNSAQFIFQCCG